MLVTIYQIIPDVISFPQSQYTFNITENLQLLATIGNVSIQEMDHPGLKGIQYDIIAGNGSEAFIISSTGAISNIIITDRETTVSYTLIIEATVIDIPGIMPARANVSINVVDVNDEVPVFNQSIYRANFIAIVDAHSSITTVFAYDEDVGSNARITYKISDGDQLFQINNTTGEIQNTESLILESAYILHVEASDQGTPSNTATTVVLVSIAFPIVTVLNFPQSKYTLNVSEDASLGTSLGFITLTHHDGSAIENVVYTINSTVFAVDGNNGEIYTRQKLDYEEMSQYNISLTAVLQVDGTELSASTLVIVSVTDRNDNAPMFTNLPNTVAVSEQSPNDTQVFQVEATDVDSTTLTYSVADEHFDITSTGMVFIKGDIDRERQDQYILLIAVEDSGGLSEYALLTVDISDTNDNTPVLLTGNEECFVHERTENSSACNLIFTDRDLAENASIRITSVTGGGYRYSTENVRDNIITLIVLSAVDYEAHSSINITVEFEDSGVIPNNNSKSLIIQVMDEPDNVPMFNDSNPQFELLTRVPNGSRIFSLLATDADKDEIMYDIVEVNPTNLSERFYITPFTGVVLIVALDPPFISDSTVTLTISATDNSMYTLSSQSNVAINIIPNTLSFTQSTYEFQLLEERPRGTSVGIIEIDTDSQASDIELSIDPDNVPFQITSNRDGNNRVLTGTIQTTAMIDRDDDERNQFVFTITAQRTTVPETATATVTIIIQDINDNAPVYTGNTHLIIEENAGSFTIIATISATDEDHGENGRIARYILNNNPNFTINNQGELQSTVVFDYEARQTPYDITVEITDAGQPSMTMTYNLIVEVLNTNDNSPVFNSSLYFVDIREGETVGQTLLLVTAEDKDLEPYSIRESSLVDPLTSTPPGLTIIGRKHDSSSYEIILSCMSPPPQQTVYTFELTADDGDSIATSTLLVGLFTQVNFIQFDLVNLPEINDIAARLIPQIQGSVITVYGSRSIGLNVHLYTIEQIGNGQATM